MSIYLQTVDQEEQVLEYTIKQDLNNVLGIAYETVAVFCYFQKKQDDPIKRQMQKINLNRLKTQMNLSDAIHTDLFLENQKNKKLKTLREKYFKEFQSEQQKLDQLIKQNTFPQNLKDFFLQGIQDQLEIYKNYLSSPKNQLQQQEIDFEGAKMNLTEKEVEKLINAINKNDTIYQNKNFNGNQNKELKTRFEETLKKLSLNFDKQQPLLQEQLPKNNGKNSSHQQNDEIMELENNHSSDQESQEDCRQNSETKKNQNFDKNQGKQLLKINNQDPLHGNAMQLEQDHSSKWESQEYKDQQKQLLLTDDQKEEPQNSQNNELQPCQPQQEKDRQPKQLIPEKFDVSAKNQQDNDKQLKYLSDPQNAMNSKPQKWNPKKS